MKKILFIAILVIAATFCYGQQGIVVQPSPAEKVAEKIAKKMKDTLQLDASQYQQVYSINIQLGEQKANARKLYTSSELGTRIQQIENGRDSLYQQVLPADKFELYRQKKRALVSMN